MAHRKVVVTIPSVTGVPHDAVTNTFHFLTPTPSGTPSTVPELEAMRDAVKGFYDQVVDSAPFGGSGSARLTVILSGVVLQPTLFIKIYRCETEIAVGASPEPIITYEVSITALPTANLPYPTEVAVCLSFKGLLDTSIPAARQRGRIYLGPVHLVGNMVGNRLVFPAGYRANVAASASWLRAFSTAGIDWCVWSHAELQAFPVVAGWVDNAFDTQRRRGTDATARTIW